MLSRRRAEGWIDVHAHFSPPKTSEELSAGLRVMHAGCFLAAQPYVWTADEALGHMDRNGIAMQLLSNIPKAVGSLKASNDYGASVVAEYPSRFGLLVALPTDNPDAALGEIARTGLLPGTDGFAVTCCYNGVYLGDLRLAPVWDALDRLRATVFVHPDAYAGPSLGRPSPLIEVAFETARTVVDMLYAGVFRDYPGIRFVLAHCGGALPSFAGRLALLGAEPWVPNPRNITREEITGHLAGLYFDTAATGTAHSLRSVLALTTCDHLVYGSDFGVPCSSEATLTANLSAFLNFADLSLEQINAVGCAALRLFPRIAHRLGAVAISEPS